MSKTFSKYDITEANLAFKSFLGVIYNALKYSLTVKSAIFGYHNDNTLRSAARIILADNGIGRTIKEITFDIEGYNDFSDKASNVIRMINGLNFESCYNYSYPNNPYGFTDASIKKRRNALSDIDKIINQLMTSINSANLIVTYAEFDSDAYTLKVRIEKILTLDNKSLRYAEGICKYLSDLEYNLPHPSNFGAAINDMINVAIIKAFASEEIKADSTIDRDTVYASMIQVNTSITDEYNPGIDLDIDYLLGFTSADNEEEDIDE